MKPTIASATIAYGARIAHQAAGNTSIYVNRRHSDATVMGVPSISAKEIVN